MNADIECDPITYGLDADDVIVYVDEHWEPFARSNGAPELTAECVVGKTLDSFIADARVRHLYDLLFAQVRRQQTPISFPLRCDGPHVRRKLEIRVEPEAEGHLRVCSRTLQVELRDSICLPSGGPETTNSYTTICSWCKKVHVEDQWCEVEEAVIRLQLLSSTPELTHGLCPACADDLTRRIDDA